MKQANQTYILLGIIVLIALGIRVWGVNFGLPNLFHPDEPNKIIMAQNMFKTGDLNPHYFKKPTLFIYINALAYIPYFLIGKLLGLLDKPTDILSPIVLEGGVGYSPMPSVVLMGRMLTVLISTASIIAIFFVGKQISGRNAVGLLAAIMMTASPINVENSRYITSNAFLTFFVVAVTWTAVRIFQTGKTKYYIFAGIATGLAISSKYPGILVGIIPLVAHFLQSKGNRITDNRLRLAAIFVVVAFFSTTPFALLDPVTFLKDTLGEFFHYSSGHPGMEGKSLEFYVNLMWKNAGIFYILAAFGILTGLLRRSKEIFLLSIYPVVYFIFICSFTVRNDRTFLPMSPLMFLLAASFITYLFGNAKALKSNAARQLSIFFITALLVTSLITPTSRVIAKADRLLRVDSRETARVWISENFLPGTNFAIERYSPFIDPELFSVHTEAYIINREPEWYVENQFDYVVFSIGAYGRYFRDRDRYSIEAEKYDVLFERFTLVKEFKDGGYTIRIYSPS
ncbi:MAG: ArnT family glycosyltransferase [Synechococcus sp.]